MKVLFLCNGNSCRSQMAEGWARHLLASLVEPYSAGIVPSELNRLAVRTMAEAGIDISGQVSKHVDEFLDVDFELVVTVCDSARENCPLFPGKVKMVHAGFDDPPALAAGAVSEEEAMVHYRRVRDEIKSFVENLPGGLLPLVK